MVEFKSPVALDTSVVIPALLTWHEHHPAAFAAVQTCLHSFKVILPLPVILEAYSVMTRLPAPHRLSAAVSYQLLASLEKKISVRAFSEQNSWTFLQNAQGQQITGGKIFDFLIFETARCAGAKTILTFNLRDFEGWSSPEIIVLKPEEEFDNASPP